MVALSSIVVSIATGIAAAGSSPSANAPADSARLVRSVRSEQTAFEAFRRSRLPRGESHGGECDIRIGRYCYWRGNDEDDEQPPPEPLPIKVRRDRLIAILDSAAAELPGDQWIAGQRVRYLVEAGRTDAALGAAAQCRAERSWCLALGGYAAHVGGRFAAADSLYAAALDAMSESERCRWLDIREIVDGDLARKLQSLECPAREALVRRLFWLGAPLWSVSSSDLMTEHFARLTRARISEHAASPDGESWADDVRALLVRYGWSRWYTQTEPAFGSQLRPSITGHDASTPDYFFPSIRALDDPARIRRDDWRLDDRRAESGYAPAYARTIHDVPSQVATFRRGDSALVVAAWDVRRDTTLIGRSLDASLVLAAPGEVRTVARAPASRATGRIVAASPLDSGMISLELLAADDRRAGRVRVGLPPRPTGRMALSDLLLYIPTEAPVSELAAARDSALASEVVPASRAVGVFWETYGLAPQGEAVRFALTVEPVGVGWLRRAAERAHLTDPSLGLQIQWQEVPPLTKGLAGRGVRLDLSQLRGGRYRVELQVTAQDGATASAVREIDVRNR